MENGRISNSRITASSVYNAALGKNRGRLNIQRHGSKLGSWCVNSRDRNNRQYFQVDLGRIFKVTMIATQGRQDVNWFVRSYYIMSSINGYHWATYSYRNGYKVCKTMFF